MRARIAFGLLLTALTASTLDRPPAGTQVKNSAAAAPKEIVALAERAEDLVDLFLVGNWTQARSAVSQIAHLQSMAAAAMQQQQLPVSSADLLRYLVFRLQELSSAQRQPLQAALAANQVTDLMVDLESHYAHTLPSQVPRLDYLGREVMLVAQIPAGAGLLPQRVAETAATWQSLRPIVEARPAAEAHSVAALVDQAAAALQRPGVTETQQAASAKHLLDLVDRLEALF